MSDAAIHSAGNRAAARERKIIFLFCLLAAIHVFIFSAAFPFFNNVDEQIHFDLAVKYSQGRVPRGLEPLADETVNYIILYSSLAYVGTPDGKFPAPPWTQSAEQIRPRLIAQTVAWRNVRNYEAAQPPLYYSLAGAWWKLGRACGLHDGYLLYWLRFLNIGFIVALVWLGHLAARLVFPENIFGRLGVPALLAFIPQTAFYSIQNDALSPLCFGAAFVGLINFFRAEIPGVRLGIFAGLAFAATFLTKISNLPLAGISTAAVLFKAAQLARAGKFRGAIPSLLALALCAGLPMIAWLAWCQINFGDFTGTEQKIQFLGWTHQPFAEWWRHPIFTPHGLWIFLSGLLATFWQGEFLWHGRPLALPAVNMIYFLVTVVFASLGVLELFSRRAPAPLPQRQTLWFGFFCFTAAVAFLGFLSIIYDFHDCFYPSRAHPYFTSGRLMLGALVPFLLLFFFGLDAALKKFGDAAKFSALAAIILFMLAAEIATDWPVFANPFNWFHL